MTGMASTTNFADYQKKRRLDLNRAEETEQGDHLSLLHMGVVGQLGGPRRFHPSFTTGTYDNYFFRGPYSSNGVWNMADSVSPQREANLLSLVNMGNALRSMGKQDQDRYKFQMTRVLSGVCLKTSSKRNDGPGKKQ